MSAISCIVLLLAVIDDIQNICQAIHFFSDNIRDQLVGWGSRQCGCFFEQEAQAHQEEMCQKRLDHMMMPAAPTARFIVVHPHFAFAFFQSGLHRPTQTGQLRQFIVCTTERRIAQVKLQFGLRLQTATEDGPDAGPGNLSRTAVTRRKANSATIEPLPPSLKV